MKPEMKKLIIANLPYLLFVYKFSSNQFFLGNWHYHSIPCPFRTVIKRKGCYNHHAAQNRTYKNIAFYAGKRNKRNGKNHKDE